eukprot:TRINITY_DN85379_c0_g1_i1.p1 TRINITY_DN85379_c0_g1~~TRINITY_DN85379_c0_g1_i1.p1  ORF type:complete len:160 (-),score=33.09 TRINITY_DN85379_c0_g1_i1:27-506(-)
MPRQCLLDVLHTACPQEAHCSALDGLQHRKATAFGSFLGETVTLRRGSLRHHEVGSFLPEAQVASDKSVSLQAKLEETRHFIEEAEEGRDQAENGELIVVGMTAVVSSIGIGVAYTTYQAYCRWLDMSRRKKLCVGAARAAAHAVPANPTGSASSSGRT